jgi:predicted acetylornithine/succinylornithine family transaminase
MSTAAARHDVEDLMSRGQAVVMPTYARVPIELVQGLGCRVTDASGREYLDFTSGIAVSTLGHRHPVVVEALHRAAEGLLHVSNLYWTAPMVRLAERLTAAAGMDAAFFCNSGTEAVEAALKLARRARPGRSVWVAFEGSFHGRTLGALSVTAQPKYQQPFAPLVPEVRVLPIEDVGALEAIDGSVAAVIVEPIQGEGGVRPISSRFLDAVRSRCDAVDAVLIFDEVQTGVGRTGSLYAYQQLGATPDVVTTAKGLAGGLPIGAVLARGAAATALGPGDHGSTFGGGPAVTTVACAVLEEVLRPGFLEAVRSSGRQLRAGLDALAAARPHVAEVRGLGLIQGLVLDGRPASEVVDGCRERGMLVLSSGADVVRLLPPLIVGPDDVDEALDILGRALDAA